MNNWTVPGEPLYRKYCVATLDSEVWDWTLNKNVWSTATEDSDSSSAGERLVKSYPKIAWSAASCKKKSMRTQVCVHTDWQVAGLTSLLSNSETLSGRTWLQDMIKSKASEIQTGWLSRVSEGHIWQGSRTLTKSPSVLYVTSVILLYPLVLWVICGGQGAFPSALSEPASRWTHRHWLTSRSDHVPSHGLSVIPSGRHHLAHSTRIQILVFPNTAVSRCTIGSTFESLP